MKKLVDKNIFSVKIKSSIFWRPALPARLTFIFLLWSGGVLHGIVSCVTHFNFRSLAVQDILRTKAVLSISSLRRLWISFQSYFSNANIFLQTGNCKIMRRYAAIAVGSAFLTSVMQGCNSSTGEPANDKTATAPAPITTEIFPLQKGMLSTSLQIPGELIAFQQVDIYAKENSFVKKLYVDIGSQVKTGQLLATMEAPELNSQLSGAESKLKSQEALYIASKANYDRLVETSKTPGTISPNDLDLALAKKNSDYAQLEAAKAAYGEIAVTKNYLEIRAPFNGVISLRNVNTGAYVGPSGKGSEYPLFTLQDQKKLRLVVAVPEAYTGYLHDNDTISFTVDAFPNQQFSAQVKRLAGALDDRLRSQRIEMDVTNDNKKLLPGMVADVHIPLSTRDSTFIVPKSAIVNSQESVFVIRVVNNKAEWVDVKKGRESDGRTEIYGKLAPGDYLVNTASEEIRNGSAVVHIKQVQK
jgi:membrane fusion protein (multidrug efflux system)